MIKRFGKYIRGGKTFSHSFYIRVHKRENYNSDQSDYCDRFFFLCTILLVLSILALNGVQKRKL